MIREEDLRELVSEDGCLYTSDVTKAGIRREELARFVDKGTLVREMHGVYSFADTWADEFAMIQHRCHKGIFSYGTALYFHGLSDRVPHFSSLTVPYGYNTHYLKKELDAVEFHSIRPELWEIGIMEMTSPQGGRIKLYDRERCICDIIRHRKRSDPQIFSQAVKEYFHSRFDSIRLMEYAKIFHLEDKIFEYIEVLT